MAETKFYKYHGAGNDFILFGPEFRPGRLDAGCIERLCDRRFGIGSDGVLFILPPGGADFRMRIFNPDGGEAQTCGNGIRCLAKHLVDYGFTTRTEFSIESKAGLHTCRVFTGDDGRVGEVEVGMGRPDFDPGAVGLDRAGEFIAEAIERGGRGFRATALSMGNPHLVIFEGLSLDEVERIGPLFESHPLFPDRINVEFAEVTASQRIRATVYERGAGITLACGTGACAVAAAAAAERRIDPKRPVAIDLPGGALSVRFDPESGELWLRGPAVRVFEGTVDTERL